MKLDELYTRLRRQALAEGMGGVFHQASIEGHELYMADTSFGDGPVFRCDWRGWFLDAPDNSGPYPFTRDTTKEHLEEALALAERAEWHSRYETLGSP